MGQVIDRGRLALGQVIDRGKSYEKGGKVTSTGPAFLHKGETVLTKGKSKKSMSACKSQGSKR